MTSNKVSGIDLAKIGLGEADASQIRKEVRDEMRKRFMTYKAYGKQLEFHNSKALERVMSGANQSGKTYCGCMEASIHATGLYPDWWEGHRLEPVYNEDRDEWELNIWVLGTDSLTVRDSLMSKIIGTARKDFTNGFIHRDFIDVDSRQMKNGTTGLVDNIKVRHASGKECTLFFRSYEQGRENLQSATIHLVYTDEEPPELVIGELKARLTATGGLFYMAFTPLSGMTKLVQEFWRGDDPDKFLVCLSMYEAGHMTEEKIRMAEKRYASLSLAERNARMFGIPSMGSGMVFPIEDETLVGELPDPVPDHWLWINGMDFGRGEHPQAHVYFVVDPGTDTMYMYDCEQSVNKSVAENASSLRRRGTWIPTAWPHDLLKDSGLGSGNSRNPSEGSRYKDLYESEGLEMCHEHARLLTEDGKKSALVETGLIEMRRLMVEGRFKVSAKCREWFDQKAIYRYGPDNKPVKEDDHLLDASRYATVMRRYALSKLDDISFENGEIQDGTDIWS